MEIARLKAGLSELATGDNADAIAEYTAAIEELENRLNAATAAVDDANTEIEKLKETNMRLFLRVSNAAKEEQPEAAAEEETETLEKFARGLFEEV
jgi:FtsZ-binding cell division protein ZapB